MKTNNIKNERYAWLSVFKANILESSFIVNMWALTMIFTIARQWGNNEGNANFAIDFMSIITSVFGMFFILILINLFKYGGLIIPIRDNLFSDNPIKRGYFLTIFLYSHLMFYSAYFMTDLYEKYPLFNNANPSEWAFFYGCLVLSPLVGITRYISNYQIEMVKNDMGKNEVNAIEDAINTRKNKTIYFGD